MKILIVHTWGIGDLVMLFPALEALKKSFPRAKIDIFVGREIASGILKGKFFCDKILKFDRKKSSFFEKLKFINELRKEKYDLAVVPTGINPFLGSLFIFLTGAKIRVGEYRRFKSPFYTHQIKADRNCHKIKSNLNLLKIFGIEPEDPKTLFSEPEEMAEEFARNFIKRINAGNKILIGFHCGAGRDQMFKVWSKENFIKLGQKIIEGYPGVQIVIFGGPEEKEFCEKIKDKIKKNTFLAVNFNLKQVAALINKCKIFVVSDSGLGHIAATTKTNVISIFGPTDPKRTGPVGPRVCIIKEKCNNPYNDLVNPKYDTEQVHSCLRKISPERIFNKVREFLD